MGAGCALADVESDEQKEMENAEKNSKQAVRDGGGSGDDSDGSVDDSDDDSGNNDQRKETKKKEKQELVFKAMKLESEKELLAEAPVLGVWVGDVDTQFESEDDCEVLVGDDDTKFGSKDVCDQENYQLRGEVQTGVKCKINDAAGDENAKVWMVWATWPPNCWRGGRPRVLQDNEMHRDAELAALGEKHVANLLRDQVGAG